jgi:hypothetical protein
MEKLGKFGACEISELFATTSRISSFFAHILRIVSLFEQTN